MRNLNYIIESTMTLNNTDILWTNRSSVNYLNNGEISYTKGSVVEAIDINFNTGEFILKLS